MARNGTDSHGDGPASYKDQVLEVLNDWQKEVAADRASTPTEANAETLRSLNVVITNVQNL